MKKIVKMITLLGIVTSFSPAYTMEETSYLYWHSKNPLLHADNFCIKARNGPPFLKPIFDDDSICTDKSLISVVAGNALFEKSDNVEEEKILEEVRGTVGKGTPLTCNYIVMSDDRNVLPRIKIKFSQNSTSVFQSIENLFKNLLAGGASSLCGKRINNKTLLIQAILQGCDDRKKSLIRMCDTLTACTHDRSGTKILPRELASLIASHLPKCYTSTEDKELIKQARLKLLDETKQLKVDMDTNSDNLTDCLSIDNNFRFSAYAVLNDDMDKDRT